MDNWSENIFHSEFLKKNEEYMNEKIKYNWEFIRRKDLTPEMYDALEKDRVFDEAIQEAIERWTLNVSNVIEPSR